MQEEIAKKFKLIGNRVDENELKEIETNVTGFKMELLAYSGTGQKNKAEQLLIVNCATMVDKKCLVNFEDQFKRSGIFYAIFKGKNF